jgi:hypothetical protein
MSHSRLKMCNTLPTLLYRSKTRVIGEQDKTRITSAEMKFRRRMVKYLWQDYKTNEIFCQNLHFKKLKITEMNGCNMFDTLND